MGGKSHSQPNGVIVIERLPVSSPTAHREIHEHDASLAEFLAYLTEPDTTRTESPPAPSAALYVNRLQIQTSSTAPHRLPAELPQLAAQLNGAWRELRRQLALAARMSA